MSAAPQQTPVPTGQRVALFLLGGLLLVLWGHLLNHLRLEWTTNSQYSYGWAVPFLCGWLIYRRIISWPNAARTAAIRPARPLLAQGIMLALALAFLLTRWVEAANPDWRLVSWALSLEVIGLTFTSLALLGGFEIVKKFAFPFLFFLVAVPWPTPLEQPVVQGLTRGIVAATAEILNGFGEVALVHGNIIETKGGLVNVDEACSGIRSLQASLMLSLFFGEAHRLWRSQRFLIAGLAFVLAALFNLARTVTLSTIALHHGAPAARQWHDPASVVIIIGCFCGIWWMAERLAARNRRRKAGRETASEAAGPAASDLLRNPLPLWHTVGLGGLLMAGELFVQLWYDTAPRLRTPNWRANFPADNLTVNAVPLPEPALRILRYNESVAGTWENSDGISWQMIYLRWNPGRTAVSLARNHTPEVCLPAAGQDLRDIAEVDSIEFHGLRLPFRCFTTESQGQPMFVFYSLWEDGAPRQSPQIEFLTWQSRLNSVLERRRNPGQRVLQIALLGARDLEEAVRLLRAELPRLLHLQNAI